MNSSLRLLSIPVLMAAMTAAQTPSALESNPKGWTDILPEASLKGWSRAAIPPTDPLRDYAGWKVDKASRTILCEGDKLAHEWLRWDKELADFIFHAEWRFRKLEGEPRYNSGVFVRTSKDAVIWHQGQTGAGGGYLFGNTLVAGEAKRINLREQMKENRVKPIGEWNTYEIRCQGRTIALWVNGAVVNEFAECDVAKGYIGLEAENFPIEFRNLKVKVLGGGK
ncbi:MAG: DUF1080 domain-containing protein [Bryobacterales bacterium]|nr:DUF1080 domain-containing protein [Bryobacterales bacterium]